MPISSLHSPHDFTSGEYTDLCYLYNRGVELLKHNLIENGEILESLLDSEGDPLGIKIPMPERPEYTNVYVSEVGNVASAPAGSQKNRPPTRHTLSRQNTHGLPIDRPGYLMSHGRFEGGKPPTDPKSAAQIAPPLKPTLLKVRKEKVGYSAGIRWFGVTYVTSRGRHTELSDLVLTPYLSNGQTLVVPLPFRLPEGVRRIGLWLSEPSTNVNVNPDASTLRLQREVDIRQHRRYSYNLDGPYRSGGDARGAPQKNETDLGRPSSPSVRLDDAAGEVQGGTYQFAVSLFTEIGETPIGRWSSRKRQSTRRGKAFFVRPVEGTDQYTRYRVWAYKDGKTYVCFDRQNPSTAEIGFNSNQTARVYGVGADYEPEPNEDGTPNTSPLSTIRWVIQESNPPSTETDESGVERPEPPEPPYINPEVPPSPEPGSYVVGLTYSAGGKQTMVGETSEITIDATQNFYVAFPNPTNRIPNPTSSEQLAPVATAGTTADTPPIGWKVSGSGLNTWMTKEGEIRAEASALSDSHVLEFEIDVDINREWETWVEGEIEGEISAGEFRVIFRQLDDENNVTDHVLALQQSTGLTRFSYLYVNEALSGMASTEPDVNAQGTSAVLWAPSTVRARLRLEWVGALRTGLMWIRNLLLQPHRGRCRRARKSPKGTFKWDDTNVTPGTSWPLHAEKVIGPPPPVSGYTPPDLSPLSVVTWDASLVNTSPTAIPNWTHTRLRNGSPTADNTYSISRIENVAVLDEPRSWRVENLPGGGDYIDITLGAVFGPANRTRAAARVTYKLDKLPESTTTSSWFGSSTSSSDAALLQVNNPAGDKVLAQVRVDSAGKLYLRGYHKSGSYHTYSVNAGLKNGDTLDLEIVLLGGNSNQGRVGLLMGKNGATRTLTTWVLERDWVGVNIGDVRAGTFNQSATTSYLTRIGKIVVTESGDSLTSGSAPPTGFAMENPDRPLMPASILASHGFETVEGGSNPTGWTRTNGGATESLVAGAESQVWRVSGAAGQVTQLARTFAADPDAFGHQFRFIVPSLPTGNITIGRVASATSGNPRMVDIRLASSGVLFADIVNAAGTVVGSKAIKTLTAGTTIHTVEAQLIGVGTPAGGVNLWYSSASVPKAVHAQQFGVDWTGRVSGRAIIGPLAAEGSYNLDFDDILITEEGSNLFEENMTPAAGIMVRESVDFEDGVLTPDEWSSASDGELVVEAAEVAAVEGNVGMLVRSGQDGSGAHTLSRIISTDDIDAAGVRFLIRLQQLPEAGTLRLATVSGETSGDDLGSLNLVNRSLRLTVHNGDSVELMPDIHDSDELEVELLAMDAGSGSGTLRGWARKYSRDMRWTQQMTTTLWTSKSAQRIDVQAEPISGITTPWEMHFDRIDVLQREQVTPLTLGQIHLFFPRNSPIRDDVGLKFDPLPIVPGLPFRVSSKMRWAGVEDANNPNYAAQPFAAVVRNNRGGEIDISDLWTPISGSSGWVEYQMNEPYTPPHGYHELVMGSRQIGAGEFVFQRIAMSYGTQVNRSPGYVKYGRLRAHLDTWTPDYQVGGFPSIWLEADEGIGAQPDGTSNNSQYRSANGETPENWSSRQTDPSKISPRRWLEIVIELFGDGAKSPTIQFGGPKIIYAKPYGTLCWEDGSEISGGTVIRNVQDPTTASEYTGEWTEGGFLSVLPATPEVNKIAPFNVLCITDKGARELKERSADGPLRLEYRGKVVMVRLPSRIPVTMNTQTATKLENGVYRIFGQGETQEGQVLEEGEMHRSMWR